MNLLSTFEHIENTPGFILPHLAETTSRNKCFVWSCYSSPPFIPGGMFQEPQQIHVTTENTKSVYS